MSLLREDQQGLTGRFRIVSWPMLTKHLIRRYDYLSMEILVPYNNNIFFILLLLYFIIINIYSLLLIFLKNCFFLYCKT